MPPDDPETPPVTPAIVVPPVVIAEPPAEPAPAENAQALAQITAHIESLETRIDTAIEGERTWTTETITSLRQELANLQANLLQVTEGYPAQITALREELARLSLSLQAPVEEPEVVAELVVPPIIPEGVDATLPDASVQPALPKGKRRVV